MIQDIISLQLSLRFLSFMTLPLGKAFHDQLASDVLVRNFYE